MKAKEKIYQTIGLMAVLGLYPLLTGFVLLSNRKAALPVSPDSPTRIFVWDGKYPDIDKKDEYKGGQYQDLGDQEFMERLLGDAMDIWNAVPGAYVTLQVKRGEDEAQLDTEDGLFSIVTDTSSNASTAAYAKPITKDESPTVISDCDISIADRKTDAKDLAFTIAHELGHCLGLGHAHTNYGAMMGYSRISKSLSLGADDVAGVVYLYPDPAYGAGNPKELVCGVIGPVPGKSHQGYLLLLLPFVMLFGAILARKALRPLVELARAARAKTSEQRGRALRDIRSLTREP